MRSCCTRQLNIESLEDRRVLAITVDVLHDVVDANDGVTSLREAIADAPSGDTIDFAVSGIINISTQLPIIRKDLTINGPGDQLLTIDAGQNGRIFDIALGAYDVAIRGLTLTGGQTTESGSAGSGGAIKSITLGSLTLENSTVTGNSTLGSDARGGGIFTTGRLNVVDSTISNNYADRSQGGGIWGTATITNSTISDNVARDGGGIYNHNSGRTATIMNSTISGNVGNGIFNIGMATIVDSTISGNAGDRGGGVHAAQSVTTIISSTISGNMAEEKGGGIYKNTQGGTLAITNSTITANRSELFSGAGIHAITDARVTIDNSIVSGNEAAGSHVNLLGLYHRVSFSLIGSGGVVPSGTNIFGEDEPLLGPLANNGGPTQTHALLPGSPAFDMGNSTETRDQRGVDQPVDIVAIADSPWGNGSDMGAYEAQHEPSADFVDDGVINGLDFLAWQVGFGTTSGAGGADGNSDDDGDVDASDLASWLATYGQEEMQTLVAPVRSGEVPVNIRRPELSNEELIDPAIPHVWSQSREDDDELPFVDEGQSLQVFTEPDVVATPPHAANSPHEAEFLRASSDQDIAEHPNWLEEGLLELVFGS